MKAIIFNSGIGKRMGNLTKNNHKSMVKLDNGETIFERQIRLLSECGIKEFIITTGPYEEKFKNITNKFPYNNLTFTYVNNPIYDKTNYIYSFYLAKDYLDDDFLMLHGDLVFNKNIVKKIINSTYDSCCTMDKTKKLPEKDFKGRLIDDKLVEVSIDIFDDNCYSLQPFYKLSKKDIKIWMDNVVDYIENKKIDNVYAENAMNEVSNQLDIKFFDCSKDYVEEIDNLNDYKKVSYEIKYFDYKEQEILIGIDNIYEILNNNKFKKPFVVIDSFLLTHFVTRFIENASSPIYYSDFKPNPLYEDVVKAIKIFKSNKCDCLISIGGGSAIDTAKAIKMYLSLDDTKCYIGQEHLYCNLKHIAIPTTAGTGSESTRFAVIYYNGEKQSLTNDSILPNYAILDEQFIKTLPYKHKVSTLFDALCQSIESLWSVNCNYESQSYAKEAINIIINYIDEYLKGNTAYNSIIMKASNLSGKAINITQTTAAHAMSYKITSLFGIPHGQAVAICMIPVWKHLVSSYFLTTHPYGKEYIKYILDWLMEEFNGDSYIDTVNLFDNLTRKYCAYEKVQCNQKEFNLLINSVNTERLRNYPLNLNLDDIINIYLQIINITKKNL